MLTVVILINDKPIAIMSAKNTGKKSRNGRHIYTADDGRKILHLRTKGAIFLAKKLLSLPTNTDQNTNELNKKGIQNEIQGEECSS